MSLSFRAQPRNLICPIVRFICNPNQAFSSIALFNLGALLTYRFNPALVPSRPGGPVIGHRAAFASLARRLAMPDGTGTSRGAQPKDCDQFDSNFYSLKGYSCIGFIVVVVP
jgi:hypothetical protein